METTCGKKRSVIGTSREDAVRGGVKGNRTRVVQVERELREIATRGERGATTTHGETVEMMGRREGKTASWTGLKVIKSHCLQRCSR